MRFEFATANRILFGPGAAVELAPLAACGITATDIPAIVAKAQQASSMKANPIVLTAEELAAILQQAL